MRLARLRVRTLLILVAAAALLIELVGLGRRSRHYAAQAQAAARAERVNRDVARNSKVAAAQCIDEAGRIAATDPVKAAALRARADRLVNDIPFFEGQAKRAAVARTAFDRAMTHPWEGNPPSANVLAATPPAP